MGKMSQYIVGLCQGSAEVLLGSDGGWYSLTSGQLFTDAGWNVVNNHDANPCS